MWGWGRTLSDGVKDQRQSGARFALIVLASINLLNFADRYVPSSVKPLFKKDLHLTDAQTALPTTGMVIVYMVAALVFGMLADRRICDRRAILCFAIMVWSLATALAGVAQNLGQLIVFRSLVGVGEGAFMTIAPPMLADFYPLRDRNLVYTLFYLGGPVGGALGFVIGAVFGSHFGWRVAFFVCGIPGILAALLVPTLNDPVRGINDAPENADEKGSQQGFFAEALQILSKPHWLLCVVGNIACSFVVGGVTDWMDTLIIRTYNVGVGQVGMVLGAATMIGGICGTLLGSRCAQILEPHVKSSFFLVPSLCMVPAAVFMCIAINYMVSKTVTYVCVVLGWVFFFSHCAPINTIMINSMPVHLRARAGGLAILLAHVLGDVISPPIIGAVSDATGSLQKGVQMCWVVILVASFSWFCGFSLLSPLPKSATMEKGAPVGPAPSLGSLLCGSGEEGETDRILASAGKGAAYAAA